MASQVAGDASLPLTRPPKAAGLVARTGEEWISLVRVLILLTLLPALWFGVIPVAHAVNGIMALLGAYVIVLALGPRYIALLRRPDLIIVSDLLVITLVVVISGNLQSPFLYLYYLTILEAAARLNLRQALAASLAMAGMIILLWTQAGQSGPLETVGFRLGAFIAGGFFLALFLGMLVQEYRAALERTKWATLLDRRLREATTQLEDQLDELQFYNDLASRLSGELRVEGVLEILLKVFLETTGLSKGVAYVYGEDEKPHFASARGFAWGADGQGLEYIPLPALPEGATGGEVVFHPYQPDPGHPGGILTCAPLVRAGRLRAWLCGFGVEAGASTDPVLRRLRGMTAQGVSALEAARLHEKVHQNLEQSYIQMVLALARAVDARDTYTAGHSERIAAWAEAVARAVGCSEAEVQDIRWAALLHDIGKIGVPDDVLRKPRPLTKAEQFVMRQHAVIGEGILLSVERMREVAKLVRHHQECWDGSGYPDRLQGEEIPLGARILSVVDAYSAITDTRPYKEARTHEQAILELRRCAGTQFDPKIVAVFCEMVETSERRAGPPSSSSTEPPLQPTVPLSSQ